MDVELVSETLEALSEGAVAKKAMRQTHCIRGIRGTPFGEVARIAAAVFEDDPPTDHDLDELGRLFGAAWEDGLAAIGLLATLVVDHPEDALALGTEWFGRVDDVTTADALGWMVLGPAVLASGNTSPEAWGERVGHLARHDDPFLRRAACAMGLALLPEPLEGPSAAPMRIKLDQKSVQFVAEPLSPLLTAHANLFVKDEAPQVRKSLRRIIRVWAKHDPIAVADWGVAVPGGFHRMYKDDVTRARRKAAKLRDAE